MAPVIRCCFTCKKQIFGTECGDPVVQKDPGTCVGPQYLRWAKIETLTQRQLSATDRIQHRTIVFRGGDVMMDSKGRCIRLYANTPGRTPPVYNCFMEINLLWEPWGVVIDGIQPGKSKVRAVEIHITEEVEESAGSSQSDKG